MSIWLPCKALVLAALIIVTIPFVFFLFLGLWGFKIKLVFEEGNQLGAKQPFVRSLFDRFIA